MATSDPNPSPRTRRQRTLVESLGAIVLIFESVVMFLGALAIFGLKAAPSDLALGGGATLVLALFVTSATLRWTWGLTLGSLLQLIVLSTGFLVPAMWFVGAIFAIIWTYALYVGLRIDRQKNTNPQGESSP